MKTKWIISGVLTFLILGGGTYLFLNMKSDIPKQLTASSNLIRTADEEGSEQKVELKELKEVIHETQKLVVKIELEDGSLGSGFLYNEKGDIVTNAHVVANTKEVKVNTTDSKEFTGEVIGISNDTDIAVVRVDGLKDVAPLKIARSRTAEIGDEVLALGSPLGFQNTVTTGIISGLERDLNIDNFQYEDVYQMSAPIAPGNSGGPLIDRKTGEVIGINSAVSNQGTIGFSIPIIDVLPLIEGWSETPMTSLPNVAFQNDQPLFEGGDSIEDSAQYIVNYFYEALNFGDYVTAYSLLGSSWQSKTNYTDFRKDYLETTSVYVEEIVLSNEEDSVIAIATITAEERKNGENKTAKYKVTYELGYENDQLKLLSGKGEEIK
jgi:serine protease Do